MVYITPKHKNDPNSYPDDIRRLWDRLVKDWDNFSCDPQVLSSVVSLEKPKQITYSTSVY